MKSAIAAFFLFVAVSAVSQTVSLEHFGLKIPGKISCTPVKDQYMSSTCWSFASLSFLESELLRMGKEEFDLSEMFIARYSLLRKIHRHLRLKGQNYFTPGGQFHDVAWVIKNHGLVPESAYPGRPEGQLTHNHGELDTLLSRYTRQLVEKSITELNPAQQQFIDSILDHYLGKVPGEFYYKGTLYTPHSFLERVLKFNPDDYVEITSLSHHPFYKSFILED
jgi:bleomycin hydrolase